MKLIGSRRMILCLRLAQSMFAALVLICAVLNPEYYMWSVFRLLYATSAIQMVWGIGMSFYDLHIRRCRNRHLDSELLTVLLIGDWLVGVIALAGASSSAAVMVYFASNTEQCSYQPYECKMGVVSVIFAYCGWMCIAITAVILLLIRASL